MCHVDDLADAYDLAIEHIDRAAGEVYNIGGGPENTLSIWVEFGALLEELLGREVPVRRAGWRPGDQRVNIQDTTKARQALGWAPKVGVRDGLRGLYEWVVENRDLFD